MVDLRPGDLLEACRTARPEMEWAPNGGHDSVIGRRHGIEVLVVPSGTGVFATALGTGRNGATADEAMDLLAGAMEAAREDLLARAETMRLGAMALMAPYSLGRCAGCGTPLGGACVRGRCGLIAVAPGRYPDEPRRYAREVAAEGPTSEGRLT